MGIPGSANPLLFGGAAAYQINQSLRFNSADSAYLNRTQSSGSGRKIFTISFWAKLGKLGTTRPLLEAYLDGSNFTILQLTSADRLEIYEARSGTDYGYLYTPIYRDPSAWYHIMNVWDTDNATATQRIRTYVNGVELTDKTSNYGDPPSGYLSNIFNTSYTHSIGRRLDNGTYFDGYMAEYYVIDGTALTPSSFGETDTITGAWIPKKYSGSYGTNGFYLKFEGSGIGTDSSGNGNTWTANNFSTSGTGTDVMSDTPTNNYCTWNPINKGPNAGSYGSQLSDGNLVLAYNRTAGDFYATSTFGLPTTGKWYWEQRLTSTGSGSAVMGIAELSWTWNVSPRVSYFSSGKIVTSPDNSSDAQTGLSTYTTGDVIGHAWDADAGTLQFYKNGTAVGNPQAPTTTSGITFAITFNAGSDTGWTTVLNCGQRAFEQTPPTGFKALSTGNLPEPTIKKGSKYFDTKLYTGNGSTQTLTGLGFSPDLVWIKDRNQGYNHYLVDQVRGFNGSNARVLQSNLTSSEQSGAGIGEAFTAFTSDGFSVAEVGGWYGTNQNTVPYVAWAWDANGAGSSNTAGTITSTVSANASAGFSIIAYTGNGTGGATVGHGLGVAPRFCIGKSRGSNSWFIRHESLGSNLNMNFDTGTPVSPGGGGLIGDLTSSTTVTLVGGSNNADNMNANGTNYIMYCFSEVAGYSKFGSYTGNGSSDGPFVFCGFRPRWVLVKAYGDTGSWNLLDTARDTYNEAYRALQPNASNSEAPSGYNNMDILSNGFKIRVSDTGVNRSSTGFIFAAFAELPFKYSTAR